MKCRGGEILCSKHRITTANKLSEGTFKVLNYLLVKNKKSRKKQKRCIWFFFNKQNIVKSSASSLYRAPERIEFFIEGQAFFAPTPSPPLLLASLSSFSVYLTDDIDGGGGRGAELYDHKKAWPSIIVQYSLQRTVPAYTFLQNWNTASKGRVSLCFKNHFQPFKYVWAYCMAYACSVCRKLLLIRYFCSILKRNSF